ncbi:unnamed protein product [Trichobilharzia regenti]|nr:unnamed protein product [Trichobilharzia regenti]
MRAILRYVYQYRNDYDYFLKADDDTFVVIENLRSVLSRQNPNDPFMMGYNFPHATSFVKNAYHKISSNMIVVIIYNRSISISR